MLPKPLNIYWGTQLVGRLSLDDKRNFVFKYVDTWINKGGHALSLRLPIQKKSFSDDISKPFFSNLLPEFNRT